MGPADSEMSVLDRDCRADDIENLSLIRNLYVAPTIDRLGIVSDEDIPDSSFRVLNPIDLGHRDTRPSSHAGTLGIRK